jgi:hypothetical protein
MRGDHFPDLVPVGKESTLIESSISLAVFEPAPGPWASSEAGGWIQGKKVENSLIGANWSSEGHSATLVDMFG